MKATKFSMCLLALLALVLLNACKKQDMTAEKLPGQDLSKIEEKIRERIKANGAQEIYQSGTTGKTILIDEKGNPVAKSKDPLTLSAPDACTNPGAYQGQGTYTLTDITRLYDCATNTYKFEVRWAVSSALPLNYSFVAASSWGKIRIKNSLGAIVYPSASVSPQYFEIGAIVKLIPTFPATTYNNYTVSYTSGAIPAALLGTSFSIENALRLTTSCSTGVTEMVDFVPTAISNSSPCTKTDFIDIFETLPGEELLPGRNVIFYGTQPLGGSCAAPGHSGPSGTEIMVAKGGRVVTFDWHYLKMLPDLVNGGNVFEGVGAPVPPFTSSTEFKYLTPITISGATLGSGTWVFRYRNVMKPSTTAFPNPTSITCVGPWSPNVVITIP